MFSMLDNAAQVLMSINRVPSTPMSRPRAATVRALLIQIKSAATEDDLNWQTVHCSRANEARSRLLSRRFVVSRITPVIRHARTLTRSRNAPHAMHRSAALLLLVAIMLMTVSLLASPTAFAEQGTHEAVSAVAILVYHRFSDTADDSMTVRVTTFEAQLRFLKQHGYEIVPLRAIVSWLRDPAATLPRKAVALTVDDGHESVYQRLLPIAQREQLPVTLFVYPSAISNASYALTWEQLRTLRATGLFDVQSHTWWHPNFHVERRRQAPAEFERFASTQLQHSRELIESRLGGQVDMVAWPFGLYDDDLVRIASKLGYVAAFTLNAQRVRPSSPLMALPRFLMVDDVTPRILGRLLGEPETPADQAAEVRR